LRSAPNHHGATLCCAAFFACASFRRLQLFEK
jgi:hypothetical protein